MDESGEDVLCARSYRRPARLDAPLFHAIHEEHKPLFDEKAISQWVGQHGVDLAKFNTAFESFGVNTKTNQAEEMVENYKVDGVPALTVDGKYLILGNSFEQMLSNTDAVIAKVRAEHAAAARRRSATSNRGRVAALEPEQSL